MYIGHHVKYPFRLSYFNEIWILSTNFRKIPIYPLEHQSSGSWVVPRGRTDGQTWRRYPSLFAIMRTRLIMRLQSQSVTEHLTAFLQNKRLVVTKLDCMIRWRSETGMSGIRVRKTGESGLDSQQTHGIFLFSEASRPAPGPNMILNQFARGLGPRR